MDADVIWFVSLREQNVCWLIHETEMIGHAAALQNILDTRKISEQQLSMFTSKESLLVNTVISTALRLIVLGFELCSFHLSMSSGSFVTEACRVFRLRMQKRGLQVWILHAYILQRRWHTAYEVWCSSGGFSCGLAAHHSKKEACH